MSEHAPEEQSRIIVWDLPTRVFHWLLVASYAGAWLSFDDNRYLYVSCRGPNNPAIPTATGPWAGRFSRS